MFSLYSKGDIYRMNEQELASYMEKLKKEILDIINTSLSHSDKKIFTLKEAAEYMNVSYNTFQKFRFEGLKVFELDGTKRVKL